MLERIPTSAAAACAALLLLPALGARADAQDRSSPVTIRGGHVYVDGRHVGRLGSLGDREGLARIVNPLVERSRAGRGGPPGRGNGRLPERPPRIGGNGILLGGEIPLGRPLLCPGCGFRRTYRFVGPPLPIGSTLHRAPVSSHSSPAGPLGYTAPKSAPPERAGALEIGPTPSAPREWKRGEGTCAAVAVTLTAGAVHRLEMPVESLGAETPEAARELLEARLRTGGILRLEGFSGRGLLVPVALAEGVEVEACGST